MVRKDDRGEGKFDTLTQALRLAAYTIQITDNKKVFVEEHAKSTEQIVYLAKDIYHRTKVANRIRLDGPNARENLVERRKQQNIAISECDDLDSEIQIAKLLFHLRTKRVEYWGEMVEDVKEMIRKWRDSDASRVPPGRR